MLILASASTARRSLLQKLGIEFEVMVSHIDEGKFFSSNVKELVQSLALAKAKSVASQILIRNRNDNQSADATAILGCDSLFEFNGEVFGKPGSTELAIQRWKKMSSKSGFLHTGHCLLYREFSSDTQRNDEFKGKLCKVITTKINFAKLNNFEICKYVQTKEPLSCAGGFALEGKGSIFIEKIEGCYSNVIGLSLPWLRKALEEVSIPILI